MKCPHCESKKLEYYPDVDRASGVSHIYTMNEDGKWKIKVWSDGLKDVSTITTGDIFDEDYRPFFYCQECTAEFDSRSF